MTTPGLARPEVAWFSALCDDDYEYLGVADPGLRSSWSHCRDIVTTAEANGFDNVLLPSGYALGIDGVPFAGGIAAITERIKLLLAVRCGEMWPPQLARQLAGLDEMLDGRLTINIISSDLPGTQLASEPRYARTLEVMTILRTLLAGERRSTITASSTTSPSMRPASPSTAPRLVEPQGFLSRHRSTSAGCRNRPARSQPRPPTST